MSFCSQGGEGRVCPTPPPVRRTGGGLGRPSLADLPPRMQILLGRPPGVGQTPLDADPPRPTPRGWTDPPWMQTPLDRPLIWADPPWMQTPLGLARPPRMQTPLGVGQTTPPRYGQQAGGTHPTGMHTCW